MFYKDTVENNILKTNQYRVLGIYEQNKFMQRFINAESEEHAIEKFCNSVMRTHPTEWERMGFENVFVKLAPQNRTHF